MTKLACILIVDDNLNDNFYHAGILRTAEAAHRIETATDGSLALDYLESNRSDPENKPFPDLIFLDLHMPVVDGFSFLEKAKTQRLIEKSKPVIVVMTGSLNEDNEKTANESFSNEVNVFINKPLTPEIVRTIIKKFF